MPSLESRTRATLALSFGGLILLLAGTGFAALIAVERSQREESALRRELLISAGALERVRAGIFLSSIFARDYFVTAKSPESAALLSQLSRIRRDTFDALEQSRISESAGAALSSAAPASARAGPPGRAHDRAPRAARR